MALSPPIAPEGGRLRSLSRSSGISRLLHRHSSSKDERPTVAIHSLVSAGLDLTISPNSVHNGVAAVLAELDRVASLPDSSGKLQRRLTLELVEDAKSESGDHPITDAAKNPFHEPTENDDDYDFEEDILLYSNDAKHVARALLDTGMVPNAISAETARRVGLEILQYHGNALQDADGPGFMPCGIVAAQFHFTTRYSSAKTWTVDFVVLRDPPFDVAFGKQFIKNTKLIKKNDLACPLIIQPTPEEKARIMANNERNIRESEAAKANQSSQYGNRRSSKKKESNDEKKDKRG